MDDTTEDSIDFREFADKFQPYLFELRKHIIVIIALFVVGCVVGLFFSQSILYFVLSLFHFDGIKIITTSPYQFIDITFSISFLLGLLFACPYTLIRIYFFMKPALKEHERKFVISFIPFSLILFCVGFYFGLWIMQLVINLYTGLNTSNQITSFWDVQHFLSQIFLISFFTGVVFQLPIVISGLIRLHLYSYQQIASKRKIIYAVLVIIAVLLPSTDVLSLILETLPLFFLFELGLLLNHQYK